MTATAKVPDRPSGRADPLADTASSELRRGPEGPAPGSKEDIAVELLVDGFIGSFIDFFYLTHRKSSSAGMCWAQR